MGDGRKKQGGHNIIIHVPRVLADIIMGQTHRDRLSLAAIITSLIISSSSVFTLYFTL
jgi:hypothetical protein